MSDDIARDKAIALVVDVGKKGAKLTLALIKKAMIAYLEKQKNPKGKMTVKQLTRKGEGVQSIEVTDNNIKSFENIARKYGVDFALKKEKGSDPARYIIFFKAKETDAITQAFKEFTAKELKKTKKPSIREELQKNKDIIKEKTVDKVRQKKQEVER